MGSVPTGSVEVVTVTVPAAETVLLPTGLPELVMVMVPVAPAGTEAVIVTGVLAVTALVFTVKFALLAPEGGEEEEEEKMMTAVVRDCRGRRDRCGATCARASRPGARAHPAPRARREGRGELARSPTSRIARWSRPRRHLPG